MGLFNKVLNGVKSAFSPISTVIPEGYKDCEECGGQGVFMIGKCPDCDGKGIVKMSSQDSVDSLPPR